jgi:hypothetical protein
MPVKRSKKNGDMNPASSPSEEFDQGSSEEGPYEVPPEAPASEPEVRKPRTYVTKSGSLRTDN